MKHNVLYSRYNGKDFEYCLYTLARYYCNKEYLARYSLSASAALIGDNIMIVKRLK